MLHLIKVKCLPILLYATESLDLKSAAVSSLDFVVIKFGMKLFRTSNRILVIDCFSFMGFKLPSESIPVRRCKFHERLSSTENSLCMSCDLSHL